MYSQYIVCTLTYKVGPLVQNLYQSWKKKKTKNDSLPLPVGIFLPCHCPSGHL